MAAAQKLVLLLGLALLVATATARDVPQLTYSQEQWLMAAGGGGGGVMDCWNALTELRSCTNEMILFFLNGESYLGQPCCRAIRVITRQCWPSMLASLGFTADEADILRGYCDASTPSAPPAPPPPPPAAAAAAPAPTGAAEAPVAKADELAA